MRPVVAILGTRPEVIKLAPVVLALRERGLPVVVASTGQQRELVDQALADCGLGCEHDLEVMRPEQALADLTARCLRGLDRLLGELDPPAVIVQGDTTSAFCGALAAFYRRIPVAHVEAGLRTGAPYDPFPEERNRAMIDRLAGWHFAPTETAAANLRAEGIADTIEVTGNTAIDMALRVAEDVQRPGGDVHRVLVTLHRRETHGEPQQALARGLRGLADRPGVEIDLVVHPSPAVGRALRPVLAGHPSVRLHDPLSYRAFVRLLAACTLVVTDSGGVQEEAPVFGVPVVVARESTERPEGVRAGCAILAGTDPVAVRRAVETLLDDPAARRRMALAPSPYGDGHAGRRIARRLAADLGAGWVARSARPA